MPETLLPLDAPLGPIGMALFQAVLGLGAGLGAKVPTIEPYGEITGAEAISIAHAAMGDGVPAMHT
jgi:phospholipase C